MQAYLDSTGDRFLGHSFFCLQIDEEAISTMDAAQLKAEGNEHFKAGDYDKALTSYTKALSVSDEKKASSDDCSALYKNKAACYLKLDKPQNAASDASKGSHFMSSVLPTMEPPGYTPTSHSQVEPCTSLRPFVWFKVFHHQSGIGVV